LNDEIIKKINKKTGKKRTKLEKIIYSKLELKKEIEKIIYKMTKKKSKIKKLRIKVKRLTIKMVKCNFQGMKKKK
jgi:hypothetical protein